MVFVGGRLGAGGVVVTILYTILLVYNNIFKFRTTGDNSFSGGTRGTDISISRSRDKRANNAVSTNNSFSSSRDRTGDRDSRDNGGRDAGSGAASAATHTRAGTARGSTSSTSSTRGGSGGRRTRTPRGERVAISFSVAYGGTISCNEDSVPRDKCFVHPRSCSNGRNVAIFSILRTRYGDRNVRLACGSGCCVRNVNKLGRGRYNNNSN